MRFLLVFSMVCVFTSQIKAQSKELSVAIGSNFHGTGDSRGFSFFTEYSKKFKSRWSWANSLGGTINDITELEIINQNQTTGQIKNSSIYDVTPGVQIVSHIGYSLLKPTSHDLQIRIGGLAGFQLDSNGDVIRQTLFSIGKRF